MLGLKSRDNTLLNYLNYVSHIMQYLRRTHWTKDVRPDLDGNEVTVAGWVWEVRDLGKIKFVVLKDREGFVQITAKKGVVPDEILKIIEESMGETLGLIRERYHPAAGKFVEAVLRLGSALELSGPRTLTEKEISYLIRMWIRHLSL